MCAYTRSSEYKTVKFETSGLASRGPCKVFNSGRQDFRWKDAHTDGPLDANKGRFSAKYDIIHGGDWTPIESSIFLADGHT